MIRSVGIIEINSVAVGMEACDSLLKQARVEILTAQPMCPGKYMMIVYGDLASVNEAVEHVGMRFGGFVTDRTIIGTIDERVVKALMGGGFDSNLAENKDAAGIVETFTVTSAIKAADAAVKAANVEIMEIRLAGGMGGKGYVLLSGHVADVTAAVEAGAEYAKSEGMLTATTVIAAPHKDFWQYIV